MVCRIKAQLQQFCYLVRSFFSRIHLPHLESSSQKKHKVMTISYLTAIFIAFVLSVTNNNNVNASITKTDSLQYALLERALNEEVNSTIYPEEALDNVKTLFDMVSKKFSKNVEKEIAVERGDTLISLFTRIGLDKEEANDLFSKIKPYYNPSQLKAGQKITVSLLIDSEDAHFISMDSFILPESNMARLIVEKDDNGVYQVHKEQDKLVDEVKTVTGQINGALSVSMRNVGVSGKIIANFSSIFNRSVNFRKDLHRGDTFKVIYEQQTNPKGEVIRTGNILYAALKLRNNLVELYRFKDSSGNVDYYSPKGSAMRRTLHRKP